MVTYCAECTTAYAPDLDHCPHCGSTDTATEEDTMPKITKHGGPSDKANLTGHATGTATPPDADVTEDDDNTPGAYDHLTYAALQDACKERGLIAVGTRDVLIGRLLADDVADGSE